MSSAVLSGTKAEIVTEHVIEIISDSGEGAQTCGQMFADLCATIQAYEPNLTLDGLRVASKRFG